MNRHLRKRKDINYNEENNDSDSDCDNHIIKKRLIKIEKKNIKKILSIIEETENNESDSDSDYEEEKEFIVSDSENNDSDNESGYEEEEKEFIVEESDNESEYNDFSSDSEIDDNDINEYYINKDKTEIQDLIDKIKNKIKNETLKTYIDDKNELEITERTQKKYEIKCDFCNKIRNCNHILNISNSSFNIGTYCIRRIEFIKKLLELLDEDNYNFLKIKFKMYKKNYKKFELDLKKMDWSIFN